MSSTTTMVPPMVLDGDTPRAHRGDPVTSHLAADKSQRTVHTVRERVLQLLADRGPMAAFEVCDAYAERVRRAGWPRVHHESPRKRISDMKKEGLLVETGTTRINAEGSPEVVVAIAEGVTP